MSFCRAFHANLPRMNSLEFMSGTSEDLQPKLWGFIVDLSIRNSKRSSYNSVFRSGNDLCSFSLYRTTAISNMIGTLNISHKFVFVFAFSKNLIASSSLPRYLEQHSSMLSLLKPSMTTSAFIFFLMFSVKSLPSLGRDVRTSKDLPMLFSMAWSILLFVPGVYSSYPSSNNRTLFWLFLLRMALMRGIYSSSRSCSAAISFAREQSESTFLKRIRKTKSKGKPETIEDIQLILFTSFSCLPIHCYWLYCWQCSLFLLQTWKYLKYWFSLYDMDECKQQLTLFRLSKVFFWYLTMWYL